MDKFIKFLIGYTCDWHTTTDELNETLQRITEEYVSHLPTDAYYTTRTLKRYLYLLNQILNEDLKGFITLRFNEVRYTNLLIKYLQHGEK